MVDLLIALVMQCWIYSWPWSGNVGSTPGTECIATHLLFIQPDWIAHLVIEGGPVNNNHASGTLLTPVTQVEHHWQDFMEAHRAFGDRQFILWHEHVPAEHRTIGNELDLGALVARRNIAVPIRRRP